MSKARSLDDFVDLISELNAQAFEYVVIGGCAVGAYARLAGEAVFSTDLDLYVTTTTLNEILSWVESRGVTVIKRPQVRTVPVAVFSWRGEEVNLLTSSSGLPEPSLVLRTAREFERSDLGLTIPLADPFDLLRNKLSVRRDKDLPHIEILRKWVEAEVVDVFLDVSLGARDRMAPARRLLDVIGADCLPVELGSHLIPGADTQPLRRFLVSVLSEKEQVETLLSATIDPLERELLQKIAAASEGRRTTGRCP